MTAGTKLYTRTPNDLSHRTVTDAHIMNDRINEGESEFGAFKQWLEETATREGSTPESVLRQLMSTYWILTELSSVLEETPYAEGEAGERESGETGEGEDHRAIIEVIESIAEMNKGQAAPESQGPRSAIDPGIIQLVEALRSESGEAERVLGGVSEYRLEKLQDEIEELAQDLDGVADHTDDIDDTLGRNARNLARLRQDVAALERATEEGAEVEELHALQERVETHQAELEDTESRFEDAYASIKRILEHLLGATDRNEERIDVVVDILIAACQDIAEARRADERLRDLKVEANRQDIRAPHCDSCDHQIDVPLLSSPRCPRCDRLIEGFETSSGLLRSRHRATTRADRSDDTRTSDLVRELRQRLDRIGGDDRELPADLALDED